MSRRPSVSIHDYPEDLNPFNDEPATAATVGRANGEAKISVKEPKHKFWTFGRSKRKQRSDSFSIKSTWSGLFGRRKDAREVEIRKPSIATVSSTYKRETYNGYPVAAPRLSADQREFDEALGTLTRRRKYTLDDSSRYGSSLTVNGDPGRIYEGTPRDTTASIMGDLTPKPPARRFGRSSPKPTDEIPPLDFSGKETSSNGNVVDEENGPEGIPVAPRRGGRRASQRSIAPPPFDDEDTPPRDENENVPDDYAFKRFSRDPTRRSNMSIDSCVSVGSTVGAYGRKKRRAPQPPRLGKPSESPKETDARDSEAGGESRVEPRTTESTETAIARESIDETTRRSRESTENSPPTSPATKRVDGTREEEEEEETPEISPSASTSRENPGDSAAIDALKITEPHRISREELRDESTSVRRDKSPISSEESSRAGGSGDSPASGDDTRSDVQVELRRKSHDETLRDIREEDIPLTRHESHGNLSRSDSFCVKEVIDNIERKIKYLEAKNARDGGREDVDEIFQRCGSRMSLRETRKKFFRDMADDNGVKVEMKELPRERNDIKIVRLEDPPVAIEGSRETVRVIELHITEPIGRDASIVGEVNPIPKPRRHSNLGIDCQERNRERCDDDEENEKRGNSL